MWKNKNIWIVLIGEFVVGLGLWAGIIGNLAFMQTLVPSDFHKSIILAAGMLAGVLIGPMAGRMIDTYSKRTVLLASSAGRIISVSFMFIALWTNSIIWMLAFLISLQLCAAFFMPALQAIIPMIAKEDELLTLNGWHMNARTVSRIVGTAAAGLMLSYLDLKWLYISSFIVYIAMFGILMLLKLEEKTQGEHRQKERGSFKEVWPMLKEYPVVLTTLVLTIIPVLFLGSFNLVVINLTEIHASAGLSGVLYTVEGIGFMLGAFFIKRISERINTGTMLFTAAFAMGFLDLSLYLSGIKPIVIFTFASFGFLVGCFYPVAVTIFQRQVPKEFHGRFFSFRNMFDQLLFQIVLLSTGALLDLLGVQFVGVVFGVLSLAMTLYFFIQINAKQIKIVS